ncbi:MAG: hypothetical protein LBM98_08730 [Oscillospiraceae bacterium]|jgi:bifunctional DNA-binding transcriptional regulator/antitoxin component of YhaV-PrlF toxin-antitoxin module|nr:hypothetical protein [Oscillospiraceae bacterium]
MYKTIVTVEDGCRIAIPLEISRALGIVPGMKLVIKTDGAAFNFSPLPFSVSVSPFGK